MSLSSSGLETQRSETQHLAERILFHTCVSVLDENICLFFVDCFLFLELSSYTSGVVPSLAPGDLGKTLAIF